MSSKNNNLALLYLFIVLLFHREGFAQSNEQPQARLTEQQQAEIDQLESAVFGTHLNEEQFAAEMERLRDPETRTAAKNELMGKAQGFQEQIVDAANSSDDLEFRHACRNVVRVLDLPYLVHPLGQQYMRWYAEHGMAFLPKAWRDFRADPQDSLAAARIFLTDPEQAYAWMQGTGDPYDPVRYLLLRLRECDQMSDEFAVKKLFGYKASAIIWVLQDVYPHPMPNLYWTGEFSYKKLRGAAARRLIGHYVTANISVRSEDIEIGGRHRVRGVEVNDPFVDAMPELNQLVVSNARMYIYKHQIPHLVKGGNNATYLEFDIAVYTANHLDNPRKLGGWLRHSPSVPGMYALPVLDLNLDQASQQVDSNNMLSWFAKPYITEEYRDNLTYREPRDGEPEPKLIVPTEPKATEIVTPTTLNTPRQVVAKDAPSIVLLPPLVHARQPEDARIVAQLLEDRLAQELDHAGLAQVVDRGQLSRLIEERELSGEVSSSLIAYDLMLRMELKLSEVESTARLRLIKTSVGNVMAEEVFPWPIKESDVPALLEVCRQAIDAIKEPESEQLKVRLMAPNQIGEFERVKPFADEMYSTFYSSLAISKLILLVEHLEASSAQEEAMLTFLGLSQLPGGREFGTKSDVTIEIRVNEIDAEGKTFAETPLEASFRIRRGGGPPGEWISSQGLGKDFEKVLSANWDQLATALEQVDGQAISKTLEEPQQRRAQAQEEYAAAARNQEASVRMQHINAAVKIDPTFELARAMRVKYISELIGDPVFSADQRREMALSAVQDTLAMSVKNQPQPDPKNPGKMLPSAGAPYEYAYKLISHLNIGKVEGSDESRPFDSEDDRNLKLVCSLVESQLRSGFCGNVAPKGFNVAAGLMKQAKMPEQQRREWIFRMLDLADQCDRPFELYENAFAQAIEARDRTFAEKVFDHFTKAIQEGKKLDNFCFQRMVPKVMYLDSVPHLKQLTLWESLNQQALPIVRRTWPHLPMGFSDPPPVHTLFLTYTPTIAEGRLQLCSLAPLASDEKHLYVAYGKYGDHGIGNGLARIPLKADGSPVGKPIPVSERYPRLRTWDTIEKLPSPPENENLKLENRPFLAHGRLYVPGRMAFDTKAKEWVEIDTRGEIPTGRIRNFHAVDERTLFGAGDESHFTLDVKTNEVTLLRKYEPNNVNFREMDSFWRDGEKLNGWSRSTLWRDLLSQQASSFHNSSLSRTGWKEAATEYLRWDVVSTANLGDRYFFTSSEGFVEHAPNGKLLRVLTYTMPKVMDLKRHHNLYDWMVVPGQIPVYSKQMVRCGKYLAFVEEYPQQGIYLFDPEIDTWYGPVSNLFTTRVLGSEQGLWLGDNASLAYVSLSDILQSAKAAGLVWKTEDYLRRRESSIQSMPVLDRAKIHIALRDFAKARDELLSLLRSDGQNAEVIELLGDVHNRYALNEPEKARDYYKQLGQLKDNPPRAMVGRYLECLLLTEGEEWAEAQQVLDQALEEFPGHGSQWEFILEPLKEELDKHRSNKLEGTNNGSSFEE